MKINICFRRETRESYHAQMGRRYFGYTYKDGWNLIENSQF